MDYQGQAGQDKFVTEVLKFKKNGYFVELGSHDYKYHNNSYVLEKNLNWKGIMIDLVSECLDNWKKYRKNSVHVIDDATKIDYQKLFSDNNVPNNIDYLQIDLDVDTGSTLNVIQYFDNNIFNKYKFATITFEHDIYCNSEKHISTRRISREILTKHGYQLVFPDIFCYYLGKTCYFEDWWVHPDLVDMTFINKIKKKNSVEGKTINYKN